MKQKLLFFLTFFTLATGTLWAYDFSAPNADGVEIYYNILFNGGNRVEVTIRESGYYIGSVNIPSTVTHNDMEYSVAAIGAAAFRRCGGLTSVTIPNSVTSIGQYAFSECKGLTSVTIPNSVTSIGQYAFSECKGLTSVTIPNSVTSIGNYAFSSCDGLTSVTIPNSVTNIGEYAFSECKGLIAVTIPNSVTSIGNHAFSSCDGLTSVTIPNSVTNIGEYAFSECKGLTSIILPTSVTSIGNFAFGGCTGLTSVTIPHSLTSIGYGAFSICDSLTAFYGKFASEDNRCLIVDGVLNSFAPAGLTTYTVSNSVTSIGFYAFGGCRGLTSIILPNSVSSIGSYAFYGCIDLTSVSIPSSVTSIGNYAFSGCRGLTSIILPNSVSSIGSYAFYGCINLTSVSIPSSVTSIGGGAFACCPGLTAFYGKYASDDNRCLIVGGGLNSFAPAGLTAYTIPGSVTFIGEYAFSECKGLISIAIPNSVTLISEYAFGSCTALESVKVEWMDSQEVTVFDNAFKDVKTRNCNLFVPIGTQSLYEAVAPWNTFTIIESIESEPTWVHELPEDVYARLEGTYTCQGDDETFTLFISIFPQSDERHLKKAVIYGWGGYDWAKIECSLDYNSTTGQVQIIILEGSVVAEGVDFTGLGSCNVYALGYLGWLSMGHRITVLSNDDQSEFTFQRGIAGGIFNGDATSANFMGYVWFNYLSLVMKKQLDSINEIATTPTDEPTVTTTGGELQIHNTLPGQPVALYTLTGQMLYSGVTTGTLTTVPLTLLKGTVCILKVGTHTRKLIL